MPDAITSYYLTQGVLGVSTLILSIVVVYLYKIIMKIQDERRTDALETLKVVQDTANNIALLTAKIEVSRGSRGR